MRCVDYFWTIWLCCMKLKSSARPLKKICFKSLEQPPRAKTAPYLNNLTPKKLNYSLQPPGKNMPCLWLTDPSISELKLLSIHDSHDGARITVAQLEKDFVFNNDASCGSFPTRYHAFTIIFGASVICLATFNCIIQLCPWSAVSGAAGSHMAGRKIYSFTVASGALKTQEHGDKQVTFRRWRLVKNDWSCAGSAR